MIDFEQEIEGRLHHFQHLTGKGNVKDGNRTLYEILRLMLGMINQTAATPLAPPPTPLARPFDEDAPRAVTTTTTQPMDHDIAEYLRVQPIAAPIAPAPVLVTSDEQLGVVTTNAAQHVPAPPKPRGEYKPADADAPFGYTRAGHPRTSLPTHGLTESGLPRKTARRQPLIGT